MAFPDKLVAWSQNNKEKVLRYIILTQALLGLLLIAFGYYAGLAHFHLIREGARAQGQIVSHMEEHFRRGSNNWNTTAFMPIVEFRAGDRVIHFKDWMGSSSTGNLNTSVTFLYDPANPMVAMIDRPVMNWIPWGPSFAVGLFLILVAFRNSARSRIS